MRWFIEAEVSMRKIKCTCGNVANQPTTHNKHYTQVTYVA